MDFREMNSQDKPRAACLDWRYLIPKVPYLGARPDQYKAFIKSGLEQEYTIAQILMALHFSGLHASPCHLSHMLCKWGFFREQLEYLYLPPHEHQHQTVIESIAQKMANNMSSTEAESLWRLNEGARDPSRRVVENEDPLAIILLSWATGQYRQEKQIAGVRASLQGPAIGLNSELPRQPDRKVCITCGNRVDGVIYCSEQCRPSASIEWYLHHSIRAETPTITEGFRTARSRFISPSADSCATYDTTQFVPPPYSLVDANPPPPKFVPVKEEPQENAGLEELTLYSGLVKQPAWPSVVSPSPANNSLLDPEWRIKLPPIIALLSHNKDRESYQNFERY